MSNLRAKGMNEALSQEYGDHMNKYMGTEEHDITESNWLGLLSDGKSGDQELETVLLKTFYEYFLLWQKKQASYGPHNIGAFGAAGCLIRANDKIQRLRRHYFLNKDVSLSDETIDDTWLDLLGYAAMGLMCERGQWPGIE